MHVRKREHDLILRMKWSTDTEESDILSALLTLQYLLVNVARCNAVRVFGSHTSNP